VIELKVGEAGRRAIGQIVGYMGDLTNGKKPIRGILVAKDFSPHAIAATLIIPSLQLRKYNFKFSFETVGGG
jgi:RecB family endonuclease NucS